MDVEDGSGDRLAPLDGDDEDGIPGGGEPGGHLEGRSGQGLGDDDGGEIDEVAEAELDVTGVETKGLGLARPTSEDRGGVSGGAEEGGVPDRAAGTVEDDGFPDGVLADSAEELDLDTELGRGGSDPDGRAVGDPAGRTAAGKGLSDDDDHPLSLRRPPPRGKQGQPTGPASPSSPATLAAGGPLSVARPAAWGWLDRSAAGGGPNGLWRAGSTDAEDAAMRTALILGLWLLAGWNLGATLEFLVGIPTWLGVAGGLLGGIVALRSSPRRPSPRRLAPGQLSLDRR